MPAVGTAGGSKMGEIGPNFITQTHEGRSDVVISTASMIERLYPEGQFFVYDAGLDEESRDHLNSFDTTVIVDWREQADFEANRGRWLARLADLESKIEANTYLHHFYHKVFGIEFTYSGIIRWDFYMRQKPLSILDLTSRVDGNIVWLDDDAIVINRFDEIFDHEFDIGVTLRSKYDERKQDISALNAGVLFFNTSSEKIRTFVTGWLDVIERLDLTKHREQIALTTLVREENPEIYQSYYAASDLTIDGLNMTVRTFPCLRYNYAALTGGINPEKNKILHFRGRSTLDEEVNNELVADIRENGLRNWHREGLNEPTGF